MALVSTNPYGGPNQIVPHAHLSEVAHEIATKPVALFFKAGDMFTPLEPSEESKQQCALQNDRAKRNPEYITIDAGFLEHLLNCLANQKYIPAPTSDLGEIESENQAVIDRAWCKGMDMLIKPKEERPRDIKVVKT